MTKAESYSLQFNGPQLEFTVIQNGVRRRLQSAAGVIAPGNTYHVVGTYDGGVQRLYVNGNEVSSNPLTGGLSVTASDVLIGSWDGGSEFFNGVIDEAAVYDAALPSDRVRVHYSTGTGATSPTPPAAPTNLTATQQKKGKAHVSLAWTDRSTNESSFVLERSRNGFTSVDSTVTLAANATTYSDGNVVAGTTYAYRVKAVNAAGSSGYSNVATATVR